MAITDDLAQAVRSRDASAIFALLFEQEGGYDPSTGRPRTKSSVPIVSSRARIETELWDFKANVPRTDAEWAVMARHVLAFHNHRGGVLIYGIRDSDCAYVGAVDRLDSKMVNDKIRRYIGDVFWVDFHRVVITRADRYLGFAIVPPRGAQMAFFAADAPLVDGKRDFLRGESALRQGTPPRCFSDDPGGGPLTRTSARSRQSLALREGSRANSSSTFGARSSAPERRRVRAGARRHPSACLRNTMRVWTQLISRALFNVE